MVVDDVPDGATVVMRKARIIVRQKSMYNISEKSYTPKTFAFGKNCNNPTRKIKPGKIVH